MGLGVMGCVQLPLGRGPPGTGTVSVNTLDMSFSMLDTYSLQWGNHLVVLEGQ
jgi:hypothetical protein